MSRLTIKEKEELIVGTILSCNNEIKKLSGIVSLNENQQQKINIYGFNMFNLMKDVNPLFENFESIPENINFVKNSRGNFYSYFKKVYNFLDGYELNVQRTLNESLNVDGNVGDIQLNLVSFKSDLRNIISDLSKKDDLDKLSPEILKIKTLAKRPILIYGYDICNNLSLQKELFDTFKISMNDIISICYDKTNKQILFITNITSNIICYDLEKDILDYYNNVNQIDQLPKKQLTPKEYFSDLKILIHNNIIEIYQNINLFGLKFEDNLYNDNKISTVVQKTQENMGIPSVIRK